MIDTPWKGRMEFLNAVWTNYLGKDVVPEYRNTMMRHITLILDQNPTYSLVDCGCGTGLIFKMLPEEHRHRYTGFDFTADAVNFCRTHYPEHADKFYQGDLLKSATFKRGDLMITQNVIQHILLWQEALRHIIEKQPETILMCERTHHEPSMIAGYLAPDHSAVRWRFNIQDIKNALDYFGVDNYTPAEILGHPRTTKNEKNMLTIYRTRRRT